MIFRKRQEKLEIGVKESPSFPTREEKLIRPYPMLSERQFLEYMAEEWVRTQECDEIDGHLFSLYGIDSVHLIRLLGYLVLEVKDLRERLDESVL